MKLVPASGDIPYVSRVAWYVAGALYVIRVCEFAAVTWWQIWFPLVFVCVFLGVAHYVGTALDYSIKKIEAKREKLLKNPERETCLWEQDDEGNWHTRCGSIRYFRDQDMKVTVAAGPSDYGMVYCYTCGREIRATPYVEEEP